jgi:hypothetical protein
VSEELEIRIQEAFYQPAESLAINLSVQMKVINGQKADL